MLLIREILPRHIPWVGTKRHLYDGVDAPEGDDGLIGFPSNVIIGDQLLGSDDDPLGCQGDVIVRYDYPVDLAVALHIRPVHVDHCHVRIHGRHSQQLLAREGTNDLFGRRILEGICS